MKSCIRISRTKEELKIAVNAAAEFDEVLEEFSAKLGYIKKYYDKDKIPIHIIGKALKENEQTAVRAILKQEIDDKITFGDTSEVLGCLLYTSPSPRDPM